MPSFHRRRRSHVAYFPAQPLHLDDKWTLVRKVGQEQLSARAQLKLEWMIFYHTVGKKNATHTSRHFGIARKTFHKWLNRFEETRLTTLEEHSRAPHHVRQREITHLHRSRIRKLRKKKMKYGKMKLRTLYIQEYGEPISSWKFQIVIQEEQLYPDKRAADRNRAKVQRSRNHPKNRITDFPKRPWINYLWHVDTVVLTMADGGYRFLLTALNRHGRGVQSGLCPPLSHAFLETSRRLSPATRVSDGGPDHQPPP